MKPFIVPSWAVLGLLVAVVLVAGHWHVGGRAPSGITRAGTRGLLPVLLAFLAALAVMVVATIGQLILGWGPGNVGDFVLQLFLVAAFFGIPVTVAAAVLRQGLWDLKGALARTISASLVTVLAVGAYLVLGVAAHTVGADATAASVTALMVVMLGAHPLFLVVGRRVDTALFGERGNSRAVLAQLNQQLAAAGDPGELLSGVAGGLRQLLNIPFVRLAAGGGGTAKSAGDVLPGWPVETMDLVHQGMHVGTLELALRDADQPPGTAFTAGDLAAVAPIADQLAALLHAVDLESAVRAAHHRLVAAREEERRRLRDDLQDVMGPALGAVLMNLAAARNELEGSGAVPANVAQAQILIAESRTAVKGAVVQIRRLAYALRPPALDERGLAEALRSAIAPLRGGPLSITVAGAAPHVGAAVEAAAYRIALEAVHNAFRHSGAQQCAVSFGIQYDSLLLEITDDGVGLPTPVRMGVGLESMALRAGEAGGTLHLSVPRNGGTSVVAVFPLEWMTASDISWEAPDGGLGHALGRGGGDA